ncbi:type II toxin-antitoxin system VapC family toxin [Sulfuritalea hydrogenivorans]|jgi:hypothetical protein|uniref:PIN domain-containing protein n=1 Tax=Sulfuritalea hydrogenivorans sk43H TaxID=1223802 RepID=W0SCS8_9PROT|nr:type II toxin-antitoxin system VapC family toxin [Sulfuritalea hydrogenivorans]MDK9716221.1 type II toxin-antitoxin system VapC family toxin [Sulfuritalea sp.]BAO28821.1 hypothetical protein SUTH_01015 [Sulfuritalea hydrogenivorans sk43H]
MRRSRTPQVGLDSQCLSYLLDGIAGISEPTDPLAPEKIALLRSWFYRSGTFTLTQTVAAEVADIPNPERRELHQSFMRTLFLDYPVQDAQAVQNRAELFQSEHPKLNDCRVLAEAEELGLDVMLTYDNKFWKRLQNSSATTMLVKPSTYWAGLGVPRGAQPKTLPDHTNPLSSQSWWRW